MGATCPDLPEPGADYPGPSIQFAACAYGGFRHEVCYTELHPRCSRTSGRSDAIRATSRREIFTCPEVGQMRDRMRFGELIA